MDIPKKHFLTFVNNFKFIIVLFIMLVLLFYYYLEAQNNVDRVHEKLYSSYKLLNRSDTLSNHVSAITEADISDAKKLASLARTVLIVVFLIFLLLLWYYYRVLQQKLGAPIDEVYEYIERMGRNDFTKKIKVSKTNNNSILGWLYKTRLNLRRSRLALSKSEERLALATLYSGVGIWDFSVQTRKMYWHDSMYVLFRISKGDNTPTVKDIWINAVHKDDRVRVRRELQEAISEHKPLDTEFSIVWPNGQKRWIKVAANLFKDRYDKPYRLLGTNIDITEQKNIHESLKLSSNVFTYARECIMITDSKGSFIDVNDSFVKLTGYTKKEILGEDSKILYSERHSEDFYKEMDIELDTKGHWYGEMWNRKKNGQEYLSKLTVTRILDEKDKIKNYVTLFSDVTIDKAQQKQLEYIAHYDMLTNLPNRLLMFDRLAQTLAQNRRRNETFVIAFLDLDGFKNINDKYGHDVGDELLIKLSSSMKKTLREGDTLARIGGDEFLVIITDIKEVEESKLILDRLLLSVSNAVLLSVGEVKISASIGVSTWERDITADMLIRQADHAMYVAKESGGNCYSLHKSE